MCFQPFLSTSMERTNAGETSSNYYDIVFLHNAWDVALRRHVIDIDGNGHHFGVSFLMHTSLTALKSSWVSKRFQVLCMMCKQYSQGCSINCRILSSAKKRTSQSTMISGENMAMRRVAGCESCSSDIVPPGARVGLTVAIRLVCLI